MLAISFVLTGCATMREPSLRDKTIAMHVATVFDIESTFLVLHRCPTCAEGNPLLRPAVQRGRLLTYVLEYGVNELVARHARRALVEQLLHPTAPEPQMSAFWRYLPYSVTIGHYLAGALNLRLARRF